MLMNEVTLNKMQPGQKYPNEKIGSFISVFFWGGSRKMDIRMNPLSCFSDLLGGELGFPGRWRASQMKRIQMQQIFSDTH